MRFCVISRTQELAFLSNWVDFFWKCRRVFFIPALFSNTFVGPETYVKEYLHRLQNHFIDHRRYENRLGPVSKAFSIEPVTTVRCFYVFFQTHTLFCLLRCFNTFSVMLRAAKNFAIAYILVDIVKIRISFLISEELILFPNTPLYYHSIQSKQ